LDAAVVALFDDDYGVWRAPCILAASWRRSRTAPDVHGRIVYATDELLDRPEAEDWTDRLRAA
jgi:hypothetical protein